MIYLGVDPGAHGGLSVLAPKKVGLTAKQEVTPMLATDREAWEWLLTLKLKADEAKEEIYALIEQVTGYAPAKSGDKGPPGSRMLKLGMSFGMLRGFLIASDIPYEEVSAQKWQKGLGITFPRDASYAERKRHLKQKAEQLYPKVKVTLAVSDSLLIATYCKRKHEGTL